MKVYNKKLYKSRENKIFTGTMGGLGEYFGFDPSIFRAVYAGISVFTGLLPGAVAYIVISFIIPRKPDTIYEKAL